MAGDAFTGDEKQVNLRELLGEHDKILIMSHHNADPDAVCAMAAFQEFYRHINPNGHAVLVCDDVSRLSHKVLEDLAPATTILSTVNERYSFTVIVDTNSRPQLGRSLTNIEINPDEALVIDHHEYNAEVESFASHQIIDSKKSSACEIIVELFERYNVPITEMTANLLLTGMLFDTRRFIYCTIDTLQAVLRLMRAGADYSRCVRTLMIEPDRSEKIARLKAASRCKVHLIDRWIIVTSKINAFEASACRAFIDLGADVAIVGGMPAKDVVRLSARSTTQFSSTTGINLGTDIMEPLGETIGGVGGGHSNAAGANGVKNRDKALSAAVELIRKALEKQR